MGFGVCNFSGILGVSSESKTIETTRTPFLALIEVRSVTGKVLVSFVRGAGLFFFVSLDIYCAVLSSHRVLLLSVSFGLI